ncbi:hypothetical protein J8F10_30020 [Gemmata sp. G18]|uniref:Uncharacterized protein n=1 Tax=Gemmata palustris TaxID=2822762 RepID=A0ABS5C1G3_9BACT|nr:hypothetical protein [Gemmata palustris]MBP3959502.1 hypothetical protein [Gemmata palustris]
MPTEASTLGNVIGVVRPSFWSWAVGIFPAAGWCLGLIFGGLVFALAFVSEPFAFLLNIGWAAVLLPIVLPIGGLYILGSHLARNLRGRIVVLEGGFVVIPGRPEDGKVYPWSAVLGFMDANTAPPSQSESESATVFAHGSSQCTAHMTDGSAWVFGSDLSGFAELRAWLEHKAGVKPAEPTRV